MLLLVRIRFCSKHKFDASMYVNLALNNLGFNSYKTDCLNAMETAQKEMAQKRRKLHGKLTSIYSQEELRRQQEILFEQVYFNHITCQKI